MNCAVGIPMEQPKTKKQVDKMVIICDFSKHPRYKKDKLERKQAAALREKYIEACFYTYSYLFILFYTDLVFKGLLALILFIQL